MEYEITQLLKQYKKMFDIDLDINVMHMDEEKKEQVYNLLSDAIDNEEEIPFNLLEDFIRDLPEEALI
jgi:hypothetical protein